MTTGGEPEELRRFLAGVELFSALDPAQLSAIATAATVRQFAAGDLVVDAFTAPPTEIYVVLAGEVDLWHDQDQVTKAGDDRFVAGDVFGFSAMLTERPIGPRVVATTSASIAILPGNLVEPAFYSRSGARFLADYISRTRRRSTSAPMFSTVEELIASTPLVISPDTPVAVVARQLADRDMHCAVVETGDGTFGIVTDAMLGRRVVGDGISGDTPAREVMVHPATTVELSGSSVEALITLLDTRAEYLPVVDRFDKLRGVLGARDFVLAPTTAGFGMLEQIRRARDRAELIERARHAPSILSDILDRGLAVDRVIRVYSAIVDATVRRSIALVFADHPELSLDQFTWLFLGSHGRREAMPCSDLDVAIAFDDDVSEESMTLFRSAFEDVNELLTGAGLGVDVNGANPSNKAFSRTNGEWRAAATRWLTLPGEHSRATMAVHRKGLAVIASLLVDARPIHGTPGLPEVARVFTEFRQHPAAMDLLLSESVSHRAKERERTFRDVFTGKGDTFDVKTHGLLPVVSIARWAALGVGSTELQTVKRLRDASGSAILHGAEADRLIEVFEILQRMRLRHHLNQLRDGQPPSDLIDRDELSPIERSMIGRAVREINTIARRMDRPTLPAASTKGHLNAMQIAVIGDVGGHAKPLRHELARLGMRADGSLPEELIVVQVGDLIHRGPDSAEVVDIVDHYLRTQPAQWIQLIGNHEAHYLQPPVFAWSESLSRNHVRIIQRWWQDGSATVATAVEASYESFLITHAGITAEFWASVLGGPLTAAEAASRINELAKAGDDTVFRAGVMLHGKSAPDAGPLWADTMTELLPGWADRQMPFSQIHGHNNITPWRGDDTGVPPAGIEALVTIDAEAKHESVYLAGGRLIGVDPDHRELPTTPWRAFELIGTVTVR